MVNIAERMRELIPLLRAGINGIEIPDVSPECEDEWSEDYAIVQDAYPDTWDQGDYFDGSRFYADYKEFVRDHFAEDPSVIVEFHGSDEIEAYRKKEGS